jgi:hypothetical protein
MHLDIGNSAPLPKSAFYPRLLSSLGCASARKLRLGRKGCISGLDTQITISVFKLICGSTKFTIFPDSHRFMYFIVHRAVTNISHRMLAP